jgi:hypothetical protein
LFNLIPPTPFSSLEKGEKTILWVGLSPLSIVERGFRGEVDYKKHIFINLRELAIKVLLSSINLHRFYILIMDYLRLGI